jgi:3-methyladenine DNA glycosylase Mpg
MNYKRNASEVAEKLVGMRINQYQLIETEGFEGGNVTKSRLCMLAAPGQISLMRYRGNNFVNIGTERENYASCVMIRAIDSDESGLIEGPGKVGKALKATSIDGLILGQGVELSGKTAKSTLFEGKSDNSLGIYTMDKYL